MQFIDIILLIIISGFALFGVWFGFIHTLGSLLGTVIGAILASRYYEVMAEWLFDITGWEGNVPGIIMFIVAFILINRLVGIIFWLVERGLKILNMLPFFKMFNRFFGLIFGTIEGAITIGVIIYFIERFPLSDRIMEYLAGSVVAPYTTDVAAIIIPLLPDAIKVLHTTVDYVEGVAL
jgi:uncharacterized membrane protein required for colicin V production